MVQVVVLSGSTLLCMRERGEAFKRHAVELGKIRADQGEKQKGYVKIKLD